jgi:ubiquitin-activating enzyme E1 C
LHRKHNVGDYKAKVAAEFVMNRVPGTKITHYTKPIQEFDEEFYKQFQIVIAGLDNIEARRWINSMLHSLVEFDAEGNPDPATQRPLIDGGTEGFLGQARVIIPFKTGCFECSMASIPK